MVLQSTQGVQELSPQPKQGGSTQTPLPETPFRELLDGAIQTQTAASQSKKEPVNSKEPVDSKEPASSKPSEQPKEDGIEIEQPLQAEKPPKPDQKGEAQEIATAVAALLIPEPRMVPEPLQTEPPAAAGPSQPLEPQAVISLEAPALAADTVPQPQAEPIWKQAQPTAQAQPQTSAAAQQEVDPPQSEREREAPQAAARQSGQEASVRQPKQQAEPEPERFSVRVVKASQELQGETIRIEPPPEARSPEQENRISQPAGAFQAEPQATERSKERLGEFEKSGERKESKEQVSSEQAPAVRRQELPAVEIKGMQETRPLKQASVPPPVQQVEVQMKEQLEQGKMEFRMQLAPKELGRVDVRMLLEDGRLTVQILAATSKAAQELQRGGESLMASLRMAGAQVEALQIVHRPSEASPQMDGAFQMEQGGQQGSEHPPRQSGGQQGQAAQWEEDGASSLETPSRLLDQAI